MHPAPLRGAHLTTTTQGGECWSGVPHPGMCLPRNCGKTPLERTPRTHLPQLEVGVGWGGTAYSERLEQIEMNFQIAPFFCQAPSYRFLGGGHWASGNSFARQARGAGSQRWRDCSAASTKDGHRWCARCLPCPRCPPSLCFSWGPPCHARGTGGTMRAFRPSLQCHGPPPAWPRTALVFPSPSE